MQSIRESQAVAQSLKEARALIDQSIAQLAGMPDEVAKSALEDLARYSVDRRL